MHALDYKKEKMADCSSSHARIVGCQSYTAPTHRYDSASEIMRKTPPKKKRKQASESPKTEVDSISSSRHYGLSSSQQLDFVSI